MTENKNNPPTRPNETLLESWKEIAAYLKRDVRTVIRWEKREGLPVRRHLHQARSSVYAYPSELDAWWAARRPRLQEAPPWRRPVPALALTAVLLLALVSAGSGPILTPPGAAAQESGGMVARQVWAGPLVDTLGAPSADGSYISMVDWETGDLATRNLLTGEKRRLTNKGSWAESSEFALFSVPSPDGNHIAYTWFNKDLVVDLRLVALDGSSPRVLYQNPEVEYLVPAAWTPDGNHILALFSKKDRTNQIVLVATADGSVRVLKTLDWRYPLKMRLSPDGRFVVYDFPPKEDAPERDIFLLATDGSREVPLVEHPANDLFPVWVPNGTKIIFASDRTGTLGLWSVAVVSGKAQGPPELVKPDIGRMVPLGFTQNGSLYYGLNTGMNDVYVATLDLSAGLVVEPPAPVSQRFVGSNRFPEWSPDGKYLAYVSQRSPGPPRAVATPIIIRALDGGEEREISPALARFSWPRWSPDGRTFLVTGRDTKGRFGLHLVDVHTGAATLAVLLEPQTYFPLAVWSPDGKAIFYTKIEGKDFEDRRLLMRDLETGRERGLYRGHAGFMAVSPNGQWVVFRAREQAGRVATLLLLPTTGGQPRELVRVVAPDDIPLDTLAWTPNGNYVLFGKADRDESQGVSLWRVPAQGGKPQPLGLSMEGLTNLRLHPDGRRVAFTAGRNKNEVWVLENFLPALKAGK